MELRQLRYFVAVAEERSFTRAAARLRIAQPGVSAQIRLLERELGQPLLDRSERTVRLTEAGSAVLAHARTALAAAAAAADAVAELSGLLRGHAAVGTVTAHDVDLPDFLADFHAAHPGVDITLVEGTSAQLADGVRNGTLDLALLALGPEQPPGLALHVVADEALVLAVRADHPLARRATVALADLRDLPLTSLPPGTGLRSHLDSACAAAGFAPRIAFQASDPRVLVQLAERGLGAAVLPEPVVAESAELRAVPIVRPRLRGRLAFAWRSTGPVTPAARELIARARR